MRHLGIDYGEKRVGIAISDEAGEFAFPKAVVPNDAELVHYIEALVKEQGIGAVIIGESKNYKGEENPVMKKIKIFKSVLEESIGIPVHLEPEFMTSAEAEHANTRVVGENRKAGIPSRRPHEKNAMLDASAAALILKSYLEKKK